MKKDGMHLPCKLTVHVVLLPRSSTTTLVAGAAILRPLTRLATSQLFSLTVPCGVYGGGWVADASGTTELTPLQQVWRCVTDASGTTDITKVNECNVII